MTARTAFDVVDPDGRRATVTPRSDDDTVSDLLAAMGRPASIPIRVDGRPAAAADRLVDIADLWTGSAIEIGAPDPPADGIAAPAVELAAIAGPACRSWTPLPAGRHTIGRSVHCRIRLDDPSVELHHGLLDVDDDGRVRFTQLTGRVPIRVDGAPCGASESLAAGAVIEIGSSLVLVRPAGGGERDERDAAGSVVGCADPWRRVVRRGPVAERTWECPELIAPAAPEPHPAPPVTGLVGAVVAGAGALVVATVLGQLMFALFAMIGASASLGTWAVGVLGAARRRRRARREHALHTDRFLAAVEEVVASRLEHHRRCHPTIVDALLEVERLGGRIWERRPAADGQMRVTIGLGEYRWLPPAAEGGSLPDDAVAQVGHLATAARQPAPAVLAPGDGLAVHGDLATGRAVLRSLLVQMTTWVGPADWQLLIVSREPRRWVWAGWLPPAVRADGSLAVIEPDDVESAAAPLAPERITVVVTDDASLFDARTGPMRRLVAATEAIVLAAVGRDHSVPSICGRVLRLGSTGRAEWTDRRAVPEAQGSVHVAGLDADVALRAARVLASLTDPEDDAAAAATLPTDLRFADLEPTAAHPPAPDAVHDPWAAGGDARAGDLADRVVRRWRAGGVDPAPVAPIGVSAEGVVDLDLVRDGPHGLIAGTTGSGKSELLRTLVLGLASRCSPDHLTFVLVDYKGGSTFDACARLPHTVGLVTDLDEGGASRALLSLEAELRRRERLLREASAADLTDYRRRAGVRPLPRLAVVVDEFAALAQELPDFLPSLVGIAQRGRSLGVHLLLATQRPAGVVSDDIRANTNLRLALRLHDAADARDVVGDDLPATLSRGLVGRAVLRLGPAELVVFQTARCTGPMVSSLPRLAVAARSIGVPRTVADDGDGPTELEVVVDAVCEAAARLAVEAPHRPWLDPLPSLLDPEHVGRAVGSAPEDRAAAGDAVGLVDDPAHQTRRPMRWDPSEGNLGLVGDVGAGLTTTLVALAAAWCRTHPPDRLHLYVIDALGDRSLDGLESVAHVGAVVRAREFERLHRLLTRLDGELDDRLAGSGSEVRTVLLVDGYDSLRGALSSIDHVDTMTMLDRVAVDGPALGMAIVATGRDLARVPCAERWVFADGADGAVRLPGRVRIDSTGLQAQVALGAPGLAALPHRSAGLGPPRVGVLPERIERRSLGGSWSCGTGSGAGDHLVVGRSADRLEDAALAVPVGDHVFVGGPSRSGKTTALEVLVAAWCDVHSDGVVVEVDRRRALDLDENDRSTLVVVDDADRVDDPELAALAADHRPGVMLVIAARVEAVRSMYGHWTRDVARSRCGLLLTSGGEVDGDLLGVSLPRRSPIAPRPGLAWAIDSGGHRLVQLAVGDGDGRSV